MARQLDIRSLWLAAIVLFVCVRPLRAQETPLLGLQAIQAEGQVIAGTSAKRGISSVSGFGGGANVRLRINEMFFVQVGGGYAKLSFDEDDPITKWNWGYWNKLYRNYIVLWLGSDSAYFNGALVSLRAISNTRLTSGTFTGKDSVYSVNLKPVQYLNTYPVTISFGARYRVLRWMEVSGMVTGTALSFERNLYLDETWTKRRKVDGGPDSGSFYYFQYSFRNFATPRRGLALGLGGAIAATLDLTRSVSLSLCGQYQQFTAQFRREEFDVLPMESVLVLGVGLRIVY